MKKHTTSRILYMIIIIITLFACRDDANKIVSEKNDIPVKVITKFPKTKIYHPDNKKKIVKEVDWFQFFYRYNIEEKGFYLITKNVGQESPFGWISKNDVIEWDNREAICLEQVDNVKNSQLVSFYNNLNDLIDSEPPKVVEEVLIIPNFSNIVGSLSYSKVKKISSLAYGMIESQLKDNLKQIFGKHFNNYWNKIILSSKRIANSFDCSASYTRYLLPMPALQKYETNDNVYYQVAYPSYNRNKTKNPYEFGIGWIKIPSSRKYSVKVYMKLSELEEKRKQLTTLAHKLLENPDKDHLQKDISYFKSFLSILTGEIIDNQKNSSLIQIINELPKAKKSREVITLENNQKYKQVKHTLKAIDFLIHEIEEAGQDGGWIDYVDTL